MEYKGYTGKVEFDDSVNLFHGRVFNLRDIITFEGATVDDLQREFRASVDDYLAMCAERGEESEKPFSGRFLLRLQPDLHRAAATAAAREDLSLNEWVSNLVGEALRSSR